MEVYFSRYIKDLARLGKAMPKAAMRASIKDITRSVLLKMRQKLAAYEENDRTDQIQTDFAIGVDFG